MSRMQYAVAAVVDRMVESGRERGVQVAVYREGEQVVDVVAGVADIATGRPVAADTPFFATSTGKGVTATVVHVLAERGVLGYDTRIADLWPEFAANGKAAVTVRHALTHSVGVPGLPADLQPEAFLDWDGMCALIAGAKPWWEPGTRTGYHAQTFGWIVGEVVRRAAGKPISQVLSEEVAGPLGVGGELFFGVPASELDRLAVLEGGPVPDAAATSFGEPQDGWVFAPTACAPTATFCNRHDLLQADVPSGATMTARAVARMYAALMDEVDGVRLISPQRLQEVTASAMRGPDAIFGNEADWGLGYGRGGIGPFSGATVFGMPGSGGCAAFADTASGTAIAVMRNRVTFGEFSTFTEIAAAVAAR